MLVDILVIIFNLNSTILYSSLIKLSKNVIKIVRLEIAFYNYEIKKERMSNS